MRTLNAKQQQAVDADKGHYLVLAGAGSGKTTVLAERAVRLINSGEARPDEILSITFTNKAATEMKERIEARVAEQAEDFDLRDMWTCTFHAMCVRILRLYPRSTGFTPSFSIYDADDSKKLVKDIIKEAGLERQLNPGTIRSAISRYKNSEYARNIAEDAEFLGRQLSASEFYEAKETSFGKWYSRNGEGDPMALDEVYNAYMRRLRQENAMDFDDLLLNARTVLRRDADARERLQRRFRYIMVDEYQDTNPVQYELVRILAEGHNNLFCVGDDDQSIYSFRGTDIGIIRSFERDFPDAQIIRLEENYRSTSEILDAANAVISNNSERLGKTLWSQNKGGSPPILYSAYDDRDEAAEICRDIMQRHESTGEPYSANAVLYRTHSISRPIEDCLIDCGIPYRIHGGLGFYERKEIKDLIAYLSVISNPMADQQLLRIVNSPRRGIGQTTINKLQNAARENGLPLLEIMRDASKHLTGAPARKVKEFVAMYDKIAQDAETAPVRDTIKKVYEETGYKAMLEADKKANEDRIANVSELINAAEIYDEENPADFAGFMQRLALLTDQDQAESSDDVVTLMTVHAAKGLEFDNVYIPGMVEEIFPSRRSVEDDNLEEERRLCYVALTRAKKRLMLLTTDRRLMFGQTNYYRPSRFIEEIATV